MTTRGDAAGNIITNAFNNWGNKTWFQVLFVEVIVYLLITPILTPIISNKLNRESAQEVVTTTLDERQKEEIKNHRQSFERSKQSYALAKKCMTSGIETIGCDYLFLLEYHNGSENVMTGIQFCKFDVTLEAVGEGCSYVPTEKFRDDIVARYDLLLSDDLNRNKLCSYCEDEFEKVDKYFAYQLNSIKAKRYAILNLKDKDGMIFGSLLCVSVKDDKMNLTGVYEVSSDLEDIFVKK